MRSQKKRGKLRRQKGKAEKSYPLFVLLSISASAFFDETSSTLLIIFFQVTLLVGCSSPPPPAGTAACGSSWLLVYNLQKGIKQQW